MYLAHPHSTLATTEDYIASAALILFICLLCGVAAFLARR